MSRQRQWWSWWCGVLLMLLISSTPLFAGTWYVRPDGGSRYSAGPWPQGQCDGLADAPYPGHGVHQHCAFDDVRWLYQDGGYSVTPQPWIIQGGDTVILRGSLRTGKSYRIGWNNKDAAWVPAVAHYWGVAGDPYGSGMPTPPSGTAAQPTRILGENYGHCHAQEDRTQLHGGFGIRQVLSLSGASYVEVQCLDITDFSACGRATQHDGCSTAVGSLSDFAGVGITWSNRSTHDTITDVRIHGMGLAGMSGPTGDGVVLDHVSLIGNAAAGWNADAGDGTTGNGTLKMQHYEISWNGCAEEYPLKDPLPYGDCTDDNAGGYGDGFGTATVPSNPGWTVLFDDGVVSYNTQDGLDALHLTGAGSSMTVRHTLAFGNMGQQIKVGGSAAVVQDNRLVGNCNAMREPIPGTPAGYNARLSDFCRAADTAVLVSVNDGSTTVYERNVLYAAGATGLEIDVSGSCKDPSCRVLVRDNTFIGFRRSRENGYPSQFASDEWTNPLYVGDAAVAFTHEGSVFAHNTTFHGRENWSCPNHGLHETEAICADPHRVDETWHRYGYGDMDPTAETPTTPTAHSGAPAPAHAHRQAAPHAGLLLQHPLRTGAVAVPVVLLAGWTGARLARRPPTG